jgi:hypothetical protein
VTIDKRALVYFFAFVVKLIESVTHDA